MHKFIVFSELVIEKENYSVLRANLFLNATSNLILVKLDFL